MADQAVTVAPVVAPAPAAAPAPSVGTPSGSSLGALLDSALAVPAAPSPAAAPAVIVNAPIPTAPAVTVAPVTAQPVTVTPIDLVEAIAPEVIPAGQNAQGQPITEKHTYTVGQSRKLQAAQNLVRDMSEIRPDLSLELFQKISTQAQSVDQMYSLYMPIGQAITPEQQKDAFDGADAILREVFISQSPSSFGTLAIRAQAQLIKGLNDADPNIATPFRAAWAALVNWHRNNLKNDQQIMDHAKSTLLKELRDQIPAMQDLKARTTRAHLIQHLEQAMLGLSWDQVTPEETLLRHQVTGPAVDPLAVQRADVERREQALRDETARAAQAQDDQRVQFINSSVDQVRADAVSSYLAPWRVAGSAITEDQMKYATSMLSQAIRDGEAANPIWQTSNNSLYSTVRQSGSEVDLNALLAFRHTIALRVLALKGPEITGPIAKMVMSSASSAARNGNPVPANEPVPNGPGTPARPGAVDQLLKADNWKSTVAMLGW